MVAFKNSTGIKANSSFCTFRFPIAEAHQLTKPFQYQPITTTLPTQPFAHFVFMPIYGKTKCKLIDNNFIVTLPNGYITCQIFWPPISLGGTRVEINYVDKANTTDYTIPSFKKASEDL